ncbi:MAG: hypothetical protein V3T58_03745 [Candidatus Hydrothermarchaeales archaeon]
MERIELARERVREFLAEEEAQGAIEYILLAGGIIVASIVVFALYSRMTRATAESLNRTSENVTREMEGRVTNEMAEYEKSI